MVKFVENELLNIKTEVNDMWQLVYQQLNNAYKSVLEVNMELADKVILRENVSMHSNCVSTVTSKISSHCTIP